jgi:hypothetical protein
MPHSNRTNALGPRRNRSGAILTHAPFTALHEK